MSNIDFYILEDASSQKSLYFACRLIEKLYLTQERVHVHCHAQDEAERLDALLWTYKDDSFIPHSLYQPSADAKPPVQIGYAGGAQPEHRGDILLNLSQEIPTFYKQFSRVIEIVFSDPHVQQLARQRYRAYREQGFEINTHKIKANEYDHH